MQLVYFYLQVLWHCLKNVRLRLHCNKCCCQVNSHLLTYSDTGKVVTKFLCTKHKWQGDTFESVHLWNQAVTRFCFWKLLSYTMVVVFQPKPRLYIRICFLVLVRKGLCSADGSFWQLKRLLGNWGSQWSRWILSSEDRKICARWGINAIAKATHGCSNSSTALPKQKGIVAPSWERGVWSLPQERRSWWPQFFSLAETVPLCLPAIWPLCNLTSIMDVHHDVCAFADEMVQRVTLKPLWVHGL